MPDPPWTMVGIYTLGRLLAPPPGQNPVSDVGEVSRGDFTLAHPVACALKNRCCTPPWHSRDAQFR
jgi:hypothetical protein